MAQYEGYELDYPVNVAQSAASERAAFIRRVYAHLAGAVLAFIAVEALLLNTLDHQAVLQLMFSSRFTWLAVMVMFMGAGFIAQLWAQSQTSVAMQYAGLGLYVVAEAIIFLPLMIVASHVAPKVIPQAGIMTGAIFLGLTLAVFTTKKDFSFLRSIISVGCMIALGVVVCAVLFNFNLGLIFSFAMVALVSGCILYNTSNVMLHYPTHMHVAAALQLFADVATMFWYIVQILLSFSSRD